MLEPGRQRRAVKMSNPRFRPREYTREPGAYGKAANIEWIIPDSPPEQDRAQAALLQHQYAVRITQRLRQQRITLTSYATLAGVGYDRMSKVLRGEAVMRLEDIAQAERILEGGVLKELPDKNPIIPWDSEDY
jgi:hypothetical protein